MKISFITDITADQADDYASLVNECYAEEEAGIWRPGSPRTNKDEVFRMVQNGEIAVIEIDGKFIGGVGVKILNPETAEWTMLAIHSDYRGQGLTSALFEYAELHIRKKGVKKILFEILRPIHWIHPKKEQLISWYKRLSYVVTNTANFLDYYPEAKDLLATEVEFCLMEKDLTTTVFMEEEVVIVTDHLNTYVLNKLLTGKTHAVVVKNFTDSNVCDHMSNALINLDSIEKYHYVISDKGEEKRLFFGVSRLGIPHSSTFGKGKNSPQMKKYQSMVQPSINRIRSFSHPFLGPIDKLRLVLDEQWREGANLGNFEGFKMFSGIVRYTDANAELTKKAHVDSLDPKMAFDQQFAANIYLDMPADEGELLIWNKHPKATAEQAHDNEYNEYLWGLPEADAIRIRPEKGDLVLFSTQIPHATNTFKGGRRISVQTFFALDRNNKIQIWC